MSSMVRKSMLVTRGIKILEDAEDFVSKGDTEGMAALATAYARLAEALGDNIATTKRERER